MMSIRSGIAITACFLIFLVLFCGFMVPSLESKACEDAFLRCQEDPYWMAASYLGVVYCATGYLFCLKYIRT